MIRAANSVAGDSAESTFDVLFWSDLNLNLKDLIFIVCLTSQYQYTAICVIVVDFLLVAFTFSLSELVNIPCRSCETSESRFDDLMLSTY